MGPSRTVGELSDILERLEPALGSISGAPIELTGGITNRNYRVRFAEEEYVLRRPGKDTRLLGIDREGERLANDTAAALGFAPEVAAATQDCLVTRFIVCEPVSPGEVADGVEEIARHLRRFHDSAVRLPTRFSIPELLESYAAIVCDRGAELPPHYSLASDAAARIVAAVAPARERPCHNDLLAGNLLREHRSGRIMLVDWEYAAMGDPRFDLGNLSISNGFDESADERLLRAYYRQSPSASQRAALKLMRVLSDAREAAWGAVQAQISELDFDFSGYARRYFERLHVTVSQPRFEQWLASAEG